MFFVLVFYQTRFFFPYQICVQEYVTYKRIAAYLFLIASLRYLLMRISWQTTYFKSNVKRIGV